MDFTTPIPGITQIPIPVPLPVRYTNCYVIDAGDSKIIVDAGMDTPDARLVWQDAIQALDLYHSPVQYIFVTHFHPDHLGLAHWLSERVGAPVAMMDQEAEFSLRYVGHEPSPEELSLIRDFYRQHGVPSEIMEHWRVLDKIFREAIDLPKEFIRVTDGQQTTWDNQTVIFIEQGGHTPHQGLLYLPDRNVLFTGDQVLGRITPNVSLWPAGAPNPLADYLNALRKLQSLNDSIGLPAHEAIIPSVHQRVTELFLHHQHRNDKLMGLLVGQEPLSAYALTRLLFTRPLDDYQLRFAIGETLAHLELLRSQNLVMPQPQQDLIVYARTPV